MNPARKALSLHVPEPRPTTPPRAPTCDEPLGSAARCAASTRAGPASSRAAASRSSRPRPCAQPASCVSSVSSRLDSIYRPGERSKHWVKMKYPDWRAFHAPRRLSEGRRAVAR
jgi:hypothetical protein